MNREYSVEIIKELLFWGVEEIYVCAGARDVPLIEAVINIQSDIKCFFNHFEERSAGFYALGRIKSLNKPVAVITTSGTAVGELLPSVMEAYYSGLPLVIISADRPREYRSTGAPQSAEQKGIFGIYAENNFDLEVGDSFNISDIPKNKPLHINVCFSVPLQSGSIVKIIKKDHIAPKLNNNVKLTHQNTKIDFDTKQNILNNFIRNNNFPLVIVSQIIEEKKSNIVNFIKKLNAPVYIESISNMRENPELDHLKIKCGDLIWANSKKSNYKIDSIIKIGGTPTHRVWRDLDEVYREIKVLSISENPFPGMPNAEQITTNLDLFFSKTNLSTNKLNNKKDLINKFIELDNDSYKKILNLFHEYPESEQAIYFHLSNKMKKYSKVYIGNSLPIRYWDLSATYSENNLNINASRGLNGIDGQISTFLGYAEESSPENWGIFGDLTTLYDLSGFWMLNQRKNLVTNTIVINNNGGRIFEKVLKGETAIFCQNIHNLNFEGVAKLWNLNYEKIYNIDNLIPINQNTLFEIIPNEEQTAAFSKKYAEV